MILNVAIITAYNGEPKIGLSASFAACFSRIFEIPWEVGKYNKCFVRLTKRQTAILIGTILGDGFLQKTGAKNARLRFEHGDKQKEYLLWKANQFPRLFQRKPSYLERKHPKNESVYAYWRHQSNTTPELGKWRALFYPAGKKRIPNTLEELLTDALALAVWYMDDGYYYARDKVSYLYLGRVSLEEAKIAQGAIEKNFGVASRVYDKKKKGFALYFPPTETVQLHEIIREHMLPIFDYKLTTSLTP